MPRFLDTVETVRMSSSVAKWIIETTQALVFHYLGREFDPDTGRIGDRDFSIPILEDRVDHSETMHWANSIINLCTTVAGILANALREGDTLRLEEISAITHISENLE